MSEAHGPDPTIQRRRLRSELRKAREAANMSQREVAGAMDWSPSKLIRIESGQVNISTNDLRALLGHYGIDADRIANLIEVARAAREPTPWSVYRDVASPEYIAFLGYESSASVIRNFEPVLVPGLLQTEDYARVVIRMLEGHNPHKIDPLVDLRGQRQEILEREARPSLHFIMDEAVIRRVAGGHDIMRRQLRQLQTFAEYPNITIRIASFDHGLYSCQRAPYILLEFPDPEDGDILYVENPQGEYIIRESSPEEEDRESPVGYLGAFWELEQIASAEDALNLLQHAINELTR
ncbi:MAG: helix-turn-helix domain-containing protein [Pseudonocardiaceae bacterium]